MFSDGFMVAEIFQILHDVTSIFLPSVSLKCWISVKYWQSFTSGISASDTYIRLDYNKKTRTNGISKLSLKRHSITEWNTYKKIVSLLRVIPNYKKYFLLDNFSICTPDKLTEKDKINLDTCDALEEYNSTNINNNLNNLMMINMPHGGKNLDIVISNCSNNYGGYHFPEKLIPLSIGFLFARFCILILL